MKKVLPIVTLAFIALAAMGRAWVLKHRKDKHTRYLESKLKSVSATQRKDMVPKTKLTEYKNLLNAIISSNHARYVTVTMYNNVEEQCDSSPNVTADNTRLPDDIGKVEYIAVSRDMLERNGGPYTFDDIILLLNAGPKTGLYIIKDTMNPRFKRYVDVLEPEGTDGYKIENAFMIDIDPNSTDDKLASLIRKLNGNKT